MNRVVCLVTALFMLVCMVLGGATAEEAALKLRAVPGYESPDVPESAAVDDSFFSDAILVGDSVASGFELYGKWPGIEFFCDIGASPKSAALHRCFVMDGQKATLQEILLNRQPAKIYLMLGTNGLAISTAQYTLKGYEILLDLVIETCPDAVVYCITATPISRGVKDRYEYFTKGRVTVYNQGLYDLAKARGAYYLDFHSQLVASNGYIDREWGAGDGIHLQSDAYEPLYEYVITHTIPLPEDWLPTLDPTDEPSVETPDFSNG